MASSDLFHLFHSDYCSLHVSLFPFCSWMRAGSYPRIDYGRTGRVNVSCMQANGCISVYVGFPRIAQHGINKSTLEIQSQILSNPTPDSFHLEQTSIIDNHNTYHPQLDAFNASLSIDGPIVKPFAFLEIPALHATETATSYVNQTVKIVDLDEWTRYTTLIVNSDEIKVAIRGRTGLHEMRNPVTTVDYRKVVALKGLYVEGG